jgi:alanyl-tRNA synthetase
MVQFKDVFLGQDRRPYRRATSVQRCMRVSGKHNDLENVGPSPRHHTFFEMLGNFSFGDYFKRDAIRFAYDFLTRTVGLPSDRLYFTVHDTDEEAFQLWVDEIGIPSGRVARLGDKTNFWQMAEVGPCGPTSEIHFDYTPSRGALHGPELVYHLDDNPDGRFLEIWNLVFMQYNQSPDGTRTQLPAHGVDTGMGLERLAMLVQAKDNSYETDLFTPIMQRIQEQAGHSNKKRSENIVAYRVVADHTRAAVFLIADGVVPGNLGRNYVTRMIIRRAARFGGKIGFTEPFLAGIAEAVLKEYEPAYPEIARSRETILSTLTLEENRFRRTVDVGIENLESLLRSQEESGARTLGGEQAFRIYATYGLPLEITRDVAREHGLDVDEVGFRRALEEHREASGGGQALTDLDSQEVDRYRSIKEQLQAEGLLPEEGTEYDPYSNFDVQEPVIALIQDHQRVTQAGPGAPVEVVLPRTCFYIEAGGQVSDAGWIRRLREGSDEIVWEIAVQEVRRAAAGLIVHVGEVTAGTARTGDLAVASVDNERRWDIMRNHTATHLLQAELRHVLGPHVRQAGSLVAPDRLRFDFTHPSMVSQQDLERVERYVNEAILANYPVNSEYKPRERAISEGATALFGEKYGEVVRTISIGEPDVFSYELCGGTHVFETADIGFFLIVSESSVGTGVRRIEAVTGHAAVAQAQKRSRSLTNMAAYLGVSEDEVDRKVLDLMGELENVRKENQRLHEEMARREFESVLEKAEQIRGAAVLTTEISQGSPDTLRLLTDAFRQHYPSGVAALGTTQNGKPTLVVAVSEDLTSRGLDAGRLAQAAAKILGGGGGGRATLAQAGGSDPTRMTEALRLVARLVAEALT